MAATLDLLAGVVDGPLHPAIAGGQGDVRPVGSHDLDALGCRGLRHHEFDRISASRSHHRQGDSGIATGGFDELHPRAKFAALLGTDNHRSSWTVLHTPGRVVALQFSKDRDSDMVHSDIELDQLRVSDGIEQIHGRRRVFLGTASRQSRVASPKFSGLSHHPTARPTCWPSH
jgi:hypothetical protein